jgi:hypothetical protein
MSLGTDEGQKKVSAPKIVIVPATKLYAMGADNCQCLNLYNVAGPRPFVCSNHINDIAMLGV